MEPSSGDAALPASSTTLEELSERGGGPSDAPQCACTAGAPGARGVSRASEGDNDGSTVCDARVTTPIEVPNAMGARAAPSGDGPAEQVGDRGVGAAAPASSGAAFTEAALRHRAYRMVAWGGPRPVSTGDLETVAQATYGLLVDGMDARATLRSGREELVE